MFKPDMKVRILPGYDDWARQHDSVNVWPIDGQVGVVLPYLVKKDNTYLIATGEMGNRVISHVPTEFLAPVNATYYYLIQGLLILLRYITPEHSLISAGNVIWTSGDLVMIAKDQQQMEAFNWHYDAELKCFKFYLEG